MPTPAAPGQASERPVTCTWPGATTGPDTCDQVTAPAATAPRREERPGGLVVHRNLRYGARVPQRIGDLFVPEGAATRPTGVLVVVHGGGWNDCDRRKRATEWYARHIAALEGVATFNVEYRLALEGGSYPHNLRDVRCAVQWLAAHAADYGLDGSRLAVAGESAGGHLALLVALTAGRDDLDPHCAPEPALTGVIAYSPATDLPALAAESEFGRPFVRRYVGACPSSPTRCNPDHPECDACLDASPFAHVCRATGPRAPITLVQAADPFDPILPASQALSLTRALSSVEWPHQLVLVDAGTLRTLGCTAADALPPHGLLEGSTCLTGPSEHALQSLLQALR